MPDYCLCSVCLLGCKTKVSIATICPPSGWLKMAPRRLSGRCDKIYRTAKHDCEDWWKVFHSVSFSLLFSPGSRRSKGWRGTSRSSWSSGKFSAVWEPKRSRQREENALFLFALNFLPSSIFDLCYWLLCSLLQCIACFTEGCAWKPPVGGWGEGALKLLQFIEARCKVVFDIFPWQFWQDDRKF